MSVMAGSSGITAVCRIGSSVGAGMVGGVKSPRNSGGGALRGGGGLDLACGALGLASDCSACSVCVSASTDAARFMPHMSSDDARGSIAVPSAHVRGARLNERTAAGDAALQMRPVGLTFSKVLGTGGNASTFNLQAGDRAVHHRVLMHGRQ